MFGVQLRSTLESIKLFSLIIDIFHLISFLMAYYASKSESNGRHMRQIFGFVLKRIAIYYFSHSLFLTYLKIMKSMLLETRVNKLSRKKNHSKRRSDVEVMARINWIAWN